MRLVASYSDFSKMTPTNLSIVFAPNLVNAEITLDPNLNKVVEQMVLLYDDVFADVERRRLEKKRSLFKQVEEQKRSQKEINERLMKKESEFTAAAGSGTTAPRFFFLPIFFPLFSFFWTSPFLTLSFTALQTKSLSKAI